MGLLPAIMALDGECPLVGGRGLVPLRHLSIGEAWLGAGDLPETREADKICFVVLSTMRNHFVRIRANIIAFLTVKVRRLASTLHFARPAHVIICNEKINRVMTDIAGGN